MIQVRKNGEPYKVYTALLYQVGTNAPTATVLQNTLGGTVVWSRSNVGEYTATLAGAFPANKTACFTGQIAGFFPMVRDTDNTVVTITYDQTVTPNDGLISDSFVEIRVYP